MANVLFLMKELQFVMIFLKVNMINVMHADLQLMKMIKNLLTIKKEYSVQNVKELHLKNKKKDLKREADKLF